ncbi:MAG: M20 peptidase family dipeptidase [Deltaproteobacteria bacterium]|nr:MAG: M20 peptidase family dipeptidase [Deltaproteobacteria bacterium]
MSRKSAIGRVEKFFDDGSFFKLLSCRVAINTGSRAGDRKPGMMEYLEKEMIPSLENIDFNCRVIENLEEPCAPFLIAGRIEDETFPGILIYGHGDTVPGMDDQWKKGLFPFKLTKDGDLWYGRGAADNKGQHAINLTALECVIKEKKQLGFNVKVLIEMGEEAGSPGLHAFCEREKKSLKADVLIASDGPRIDPDTPTIFGGSRAVYNFDLTINLREGGHHSGNWGGLLANPGIILSHAIACMVDAKGKILIKTLRPETIAPSIKKAIDKLIIKGEGEPKIDPQWGEPGLSSAQKLYGWNTLDVLAFECGNPSEPVNAIPPEAWARCHIRFIADSDPDTFLTAIRKHLDDHGFSIVKIEPVANNYGLATRMDPDNPWVKFTTASFKTTLDKYGNPNKKVAFLPNLGGTLPNDAFSHVLGMPTIWVPHSYGGCNQHAPNEHILEGITREGLQMMTGLFWDLSENKMDLFKGK